MDKLILIDGNSLVNRAFYATPLSLTDDKGNHTNAIYGFFNMLFKIVKEKVPTHMAVAFDVSAPTFRHALYAEYKGTRKGMPEEMRPQFPVIKELLGLMGIAIYQKEGLEADDILGTLCKNSSIPVEVITGDNDYLQLASENVLVCITKKGISELECYSPEYLKEKMSILPWQIVELKSLMGDTSDNIPGVRGVGEKTALKLLYDYESLDGVYENIDKLKGKLKEKLEADRDNAYLSRTLASINVSADFEYDYADMGLSLPFSSVVFQRMSELRLRTMVAKTEFFEEGAVAVVSEVSMPEILCEVVEVSELSCLPTITGDFCFYIGDDIEVYADGKNYKIAVTSDMFGLCEVDVLAHFKPALENPLQKKTVYDYKTIRHYLADAGIALCGVDFDILLMQYVAEFKSSLRNLDDVCLLHDVDPKDKGVALFKLATILKGRMEKEGNFKLYLEEELPLADVLFDMEVAGFCVDKEKLEELGDEYRAKVLSAEKEIFALAGGAFNLNSPKQVSKVLFEDLGLASGKKTKTGKSTGAGVLEDIADAHPIVPLILQYRKYSKLLSTYVDGMKSQIEEDGKIRTVYFGALTSTGRLSSREPNLQNIPVRTEEGRALRSVFVASEGNLLVAADYSQIELRLLAHFSKDETLCEAFRAGKDIHQDTAAKVLKMPYEFVDKEQRRIAKAVNFGIVYGMSAFGLAKQLGIMVYEAQEFIVGYFEQYKKIKGYMDSNVEEAKRLGYASTYTGRRRELPELKSSNYALRSFGERAAMNMPLQGSAAEVIKIAMIRVHSALKEAGLSAKLILQVHDELIVDTPEAEVENVVEILQREMEAFDFFVPLVAEASVGKNWLEAK